MKWFARLTDKGTFALGLALGCFATILFCLQYSVLLDASLCVSLDGISYKNTNQVEAYDVTCNLPYWWVFATTYFVREDSVAQWGMLFFSIAAFYMLYLTYREALNAKKAQAGAYLHVSDASISYFGDPKIGRFSGASEVNSIVLTIDNTGLTPAKWYSVAGEIFVRNLGPEVDGPRHRLGPYKWGSISSGKSATCPLTDETAPATLERIAKGPRTSLFLEGQVSFETVFGDVQTESFSFFVESFHISDYMENKDNGKKPLRMTRPTVDGKEF